MVFRSQNVKAGLLTTFAAGAIATLLTIFTVSQSFADTGASYTSLERLGGALRYDTMSLVVDEAYSDDSCEVAVVASGEKFPDALAASSLVGALDCPLITTNDKELSPQAEDQLERLGVGKVYILGDSNTISEKVEGEIAKLNSGIEVQRLSGTDRMETAIAIAEETRSVDSSSDTCILTKSSNFPDALAISAWAAHTSSPIFFSTGGMLDPQTKKAIKEGGYSTIVVLGQPQSELDPEGIADDAISTLGLRAFRLSGEDRYETAASIVKWETGGYEGFSPAPEDCLSFDGVVIASGEKFPDALASVTLTSVRGSVLILANDNDRTKYMAEEVLAKEVDSVESAFVLGDTASVSSKVYGWFSEALTTTAPLPDEDEPVVDDPSADDPDGDDPSTDTPATGDPSEDDPSGEDPSGDNPATGNPSEDSPVADDPSGEDPATDQPSTDEPPVDTPSEDGSASDAPSADSGSEAK